MWIVKGVLLGVLIFIVGGFSYAGIHVGIALHRLAQQLEQAPLCTVVAQHTTFEDSLGYCAVRYS